MAKKYDVNENTICSEEYVINGNPELWPEMQWAVISWLSPMCIMSYRFAIPIAIIIFVVLLGRNAFLGIFVAVVFLIIWTLYCKRISKLHWAMVLRSGDWIYGVNEDTKKRILGSNFIINKSNGRLYNREEEPFVKKYRAEHPHWFRQDCKGKDSKLPYDDEYHYIYLEYDNGLKDLSKKTGLKISFPSKEGVWATKEEYKKINETIDSMPYSRDNRNKIIRDFVKKIKKEYEETNTKSI